jgi:hypothetical protein
MPHSVENNSPQPPAQHSIFFSRHWLVSHWPDSLVVLAGGPNDLQPTQFVITLFAIHAYEDLFDHTKF